MTWAAFAGGKAPASLTKTQIKGIYDCTYTDWSEVGGKPRPIKRFFTQAGSGAGQLFRNDVLDGVRSDHDLERELPAGVGTSRATATSIPTADRPYAILPYSTQRLDHPGQRPGARTHRAGVDRQARSRWPAPSLNPIASPKLGKYSPNTSAITGGLSRRVHRLQRACDTDSVAYTAARRGRRLRHRATR